MASNARRASSHVPSSRCRGGQSGADERRPARGPRPMLTQFAAARIVPSAPLLALTEGSQNPHLRNPGCSHVRGRVMATPRGGRVGKMPTPAALAVGAAVVAVALVAAACTSSSAAPSASVPSRRSTTAPALSVAATPPGPVPAQYAALYVQLSAGLDSYQAAVAAMPDYRATGPSAPSFHRRPSCSTPTATNRQSSWRQVRSPGWRVSSTPSNVSG